MEPPEEPTRGTTRGTTHDAGALTVANVSHVYGRKRALDHVSFTLARGRFSVLLGLNGAGKTTLFSLITRLQAIQAGTISLDGHDLQRDPGEVLRRLGIVFQARTLDLDLTVEQNLAYHAALHGLPARLARARAGAVLERVDLAERHGDKARDLSGGQMRRVEIARALLHQPRVLILDEPTVGLDIKARAEVLAHVRTLVAEEGIAVLWATHLFDEIDTGDDLVILHQGRVRGTGRADAIMEQMGAATMTEAFTRMTTSEPV